ncbi:hypothetical protein GHT06_016442 [Daphnia sinensis]|uniref:Bifunctional peptidase and (3S)-lysyl hydroxylase JMJD7 n=1 Tax=Daphnia sinensis TaxID=1820382 RepID=A0AAD5PRF8_9CRUS|nr:hypothetical protein GHT06_005068 [Daphnia sinensis]KAI9556652.1 hypothetical protein GHT06_016442 [Daphnia sinensis]
MSTDAFEKLSSEAFELYLSTSIPYLEQLPTCLEFYRNFVAQNRPVIIRNAFASWPALSKWDIEYFRQHYGTKDVTVTVTPNGYADAVTDGHFVLPLEKVMPMNQFLCSLENPVENRVHYIQKQNSNLTEEFPELIADSADEIEWVSTLFGAKPDAVNFWMGDGRAITSMHKDPYENMYCVVAGHKDFILHPPTDQPWIPYVNYPTAVYQEVDGELKIIPEGDGAIPWIDIDPLNPDYDKYPKYKNARQIHCRVHKGEMLYLPSMWFHHVRQSHGCIAVNYWYDMQYDIKYNYFEFVKDLISADV